MEQKLIAGFTASANLKLKFIEENAGRVVEVAKLMASAIAAGNKLLFFGNGGSAADAQHIVAEFVNRFLIERKPLPAIALTTDTSILTAIGNDYGFEEIFLKQMQALGKKGDIAIGISTSGNSPNVIKALKEAGEMGLTTVGITGKGGGKMKALVDHLLDVNSPETPRIQEVHITIGHFLCELVDDILFSG
jgi:D-sedoheptulose 7-phosphate isomerase